MEAWLRDRAERPGSAPTSWTSRPSGGDPGRRSPRPGSARGTDGRSDRWGGVPPHGGAGADRGRRSVRRDPRRVRRGGRVRAPSSSVTRSGALARDRGGRRSTRALAARSGHARGPAAREGSRLRGAGHAARRHPGQARARVGRACGQAVRGSRALERLGERPLERKLVGLEFDRGGAELRGVPLRVGAIGSSAG